jgi:hypothetical protein
MSEDNGNNQNSSFNESDHNSKEAENSKREVAKAESSSNSSVSQSIKESERNAQQSKQIAESIVRSNDQQSVQLKAAGEALQDKHTNDLARKNDADLAEINAKNAKIKQASEAEKKDRDLSGNKESLVSQKNALGAIRNSSKGGGFSNRTSSKTPRPNHLLPNKIKKMAENYKSGKTLIASAITKELTATYLKDSVNYLNEAKIAQTIKTMFHTNREKYISEGMTVIQADAKADQDCQSWKNKHSSKVTATVHGMNTSQASRDHKLRVEEAARIATQKYLTALNDKNIHINYMLDNKYKVLKLDQNGIVIEPQEPILTNDVAKYADKSKYQVEQNSVIKSYGELSWAERQVISKAVKPLVEAEFQEAVAIKEAEIDRPLITFLKDIKREASRKNALIKIRTTKGSDSPITKNNKKNTVKLEKQLIVLSERQELTIATKQDIEDLKYLLSYAENPKDITLDKQKAKAISIAFNNIKNKKLIEELIKEKEELIPNLIKSEGYAISDVYKIINVVDIEERKALVVKHFNIEDINKFSTNELIEKFIEYRNFEVDKSAKFIKDFLDENNEGKEQIFTFEILKNHKVLGKYFSEVSDAELQKYKDSEQYQSYKEDTISIIQAYKKKRSALFARFPDRKFTEQEIEKKGIINKTGLKESDLDNDAYIAVHLLMDKYFPLTAKTNMTMKKDFSEMLSINEKLFNLGFKEDGKIRLGALENKNIMTHIDGVFSFPTGSTLIKPIEVSDMKAAFDYRMKRLYEPYPLFDASIHIDEPTAGAHIHFEQSTRNQYTKEYDMRQHKTKMVNEFFSNDYVHRQSLKKDFVSTLDNQLREFLSLAKTYPDEIHGEDLSPFIQVAFMEFIEEHDIEAFKFGKVRPEIQNRVVTYINANTRANHARRADNEPEIPLDMKDLAKRIRKFVIEEYDRKPIFFQGEHRTKIEQQVFGYHWEALNTHVIAKEFFGRPEMKEKYKGLQFDMSDIAEEKQSIVTKNYHRQRGFYTDGIKPEYLDMPDDEFIKLVQHNVAKSINPFQAANLLDEQKLMHEKEMDDYRKQAQNEINQLKQEAVESALREKKILESILAEQNEAKEDLDLTTKQESEVKKRLVALSKTPEALIQKRMLGEYTLGAIAYKELDYNDMFSILNQFEKDLPEVQEAYKQTILSYKDNLQDLCEGVGNKANTTNIVLAEYLLNVKPIVSELVHACHLMNEGEPHKRFDPELHFTPKAREAYNHLKDVVGDKFGNVSTKKYLPYISEIVEGNDIEKTTTDFRRYMVDLYESEDFEFTAPDFEYLNKNSFDEIVEEKPVHQVTKRPKKKNKPKPKPNS